MTDKIVIFSACGSAEEAGRLARLLVAEREAACVSVVAPVQSFYRWEGRIENAQEWLLMIKTSRALFNAVRASLQAAHSYSIPEVIAVPVIDGSPSYLAWMESELRESPVE